MDKVYRFWRCSARTGAFSGAFLACFVFIEDFARFFDADLAQTIPHNLLLVAVEVSSSRDFPTRLDSTRLFEISTRL